MSIFLSIKMLVFLTDIGENILDIARHNVSNQTLLQEHSPYNIHVKELDWFKPVKGSMTSFIVWDRKLILLTSIF